MAACPFCQDDSGAPKEVPLSLSLSQVDNAFLEVLAHLSGLPLFFSSTLVESRASTPAAAREGDRETPTERTREADKEREKAPRGGPRRRRDFPAYAAERGDRSLSADLLEDKTPGKAQDIATELVSQRSSSSSRSCVCPSPRYEYFTPSPALSSQQRGCAQIDGRHLRSFPWVAFSPSPSPALLGERLWRSLQLLRGSVSPAAPRPYSTSHTGKRADFPLHAQAENRKSPLFVSFPSVGQPPVAPLELEPERSPVLPSASGDFRFFSASLETPPSPKRTPSVHSTKSMGTKALAPSPVLSRRQARRQRKRRAAEEAKRLASSSPCPSASLVSAQRGARDPTRGGSEAQGTTASSQKFALSRVEQPVDYLFKRRVGRDEERCEGKQGKQTVQLIQENEGGAGRAVAGEEKGEAPDGAETRWGSARAGHQDGDSELKTRLFVESQGSAKLVDVSLKQRLKEEEIYAAVPPLQLLLRRGLSLLEIVKYTPRECRVPQRGPSQEGSERSERREEEICGQQGHRCSDESDHGHPKDKRPRLDVEQHVDAGDGSRAENIGKRRKRRQGKEVEETGSDGVTWGLDLDDELGKTEQAKESERTSHAAATPGASLSQECDSSAPGRNSASPQCPADGAPVSSFASVSPSLSSLSVSCVPSTRKKTEQHLVRMGLPKFFDFHLPLFSAFLLCMHRHKSSLPLQLHRVSPALRSQPETRGQEEKAEQGGSSVTTRVSVFQDSSENAEDKLTRNGEGSDSFEDLEGDVLSRDEVRSCHRKERIFLESEEKRLHASLRRAVEAIAMTPADTFSLVQHLRQGQVENKEEGVEKFRRGDRCTGPCCARDGSSSPLCTQVPSPLSVNPNGGRPSRLQLPPTLRAETLQPALLTAAHNAVLSTRQLASRVHAAFALAEEMRFLEDSRHTDEGQGRDKQEIPIDLRASEGRPRGGNAAVKCTSLASASVVNEGPCSSSSLSTSSLETCSSSHSVSPRSSPFGVEVFALEKVNGENAQISFSVALDAWCICSKNVSLLVPSEALSEETELKEEHRETEHPPRECWPTGQRTTDAGKEEGRGAEPNRKVNNEDNEARGISSSQPLGETTRHDAGVEDHILDRKELRYQHAIKVACAWKRLLSGRSEHQVESLKRFLSNHTIVGEFVGCKKKQHFLPYWEPSYAKLFLSRVSSTSSLSSSSFPYLIFYAAVPHDGFQVCLPPHAALTLLREKYQLPTARIFSSFSASSLVPFLEQLQSVVDETFCSDMHVGGVGEGVVLYFTGPCHASASSLSPSASFDASPSSCASGEHSDDTRSRRGHDALLSSSSLPSSSPPSSSSSSSALPASLPSPPLCVFPLVLGLAKVKSLGYLLRRRIREKLRHSISSFSLVPLAPHMLAVSASPAFSFFSSLGLHHPAASARSSLIPHLLKNRQQLSCRQRRKLRALLATSLLTSELNPEEGGLSERAQESPSSPLRSARGSESVFKDERQACGDRNQIRWGDGNSESVREAREETDINESLRAAFDRIQLIAWSQLERGQNEQQEAGEGEPDEDRERHTFSRTSAKRTPNSSETTHIPGWAEKLLTGKTEAAAGLRVDAACAALTTDPHMWTCSFSSLSDSEEYSSSLGVLAERSECWLIEFVQEAIGHLPLQPAFNPAVVRLRSLVSSPSSRSSAANRGGISSLRTALHASRSEDVKADGEERASEGLCRSTEKALEVRAKGEAPGSSRGKTPATEERARTKAPEDVSGRQIEEGEATSKIAKAQRRNETEDRGKHGETETQVGGAKEGYVDNKDRNSRLRNHSDVAVDIILSLTRKYEDALLYAASLASAAVLASALDLPVSSSSPSSTSSSCVGAGDLKHQNNGKKRLFDRDGSSLLSFLEKRINEERLRTIMEHLEAFVDLRFLNFMDEASTFRLSLEKDRRHMQETASVDGRGRTRQDREKGRTETICVAKEETEEGSSEPILPAPCAGSYGTGESEKNGAAKKQTLCMLSMSPTPVSRRSRDNACENKGAECLSDSLCRSSAPSISPSLAISPLPSCSPLGVSSTPVGCGVPSHAASSPPVLCLVVPPLALSFSVYRFLNTFAGSRGFRLVVRHCLFYPCEGLTNSGRQLKSGSDAASASSLCRSPPLSSSDLSSCAAFTCPPSSAHSSPSQRPSSSAAVTVVWGYGSPASHEDEMETPAAVSLKNLGRLCLLARHQPSGSGEEDMDGIAEFSSNERETGARTGSTAAGRPTGKVGAALDLTANAERTRDGEPKNLWVTAALNFCRVVEEDGDEEGKKNMTDGGNEDEVAIEKEGSTSGERGAGRSQKDPEVNGEERSSSCRGAASHALGQRGVAPTFFSSHADKVQAGKLETEDELKKGENTLAETLRHVVVTSATVRFLELFPSCLTPERFLSQAFMLLRFWRCFPTELQKQGDGAVDPQAADSSPWSLPHSLRKCEGGDWIGTGASFCSCASISYGSSFNAPPCPSAAVASSHCPTSSLLPHCVVGPAERKEETLEGADDPGVPVTSTGRASRGICLKSDFSKSSRCLLSDRTPAAIRKNQIFFIADSLPQNPTGFAKMQCVNSSLSKSQPKFEGVNGIGVELSELEGEETTMKGLRQFVRIVEAFKGNVDESSWPGRPLQSPEGCSRECVRNASLRPRRQSATREGTGEPTVSTGDDPRSQAASTSGRICSEGIPGSQNGTGREKGDTVQGPEHPAAFPTRQKGGEKNSFSFVTRTDEQPKSARVKSQAETPPLALITCVLPVGFPGCGKSTALMHFVHEAVNNCVARREEDWKQRRLRECVREGDQETGQTGAKDGMEDLQDDRQGQRACGKRRTEHRYLAGVDATADEIAITIWNASPLRPDLPLSSPRASTSLPFPQRSEQSTSSDLRHHAAAAASGEPGTEGRHRKARIRSGRVSKPRQEASDVCLDVAGGSTFGTVDILFYVSSDEATGAALRRRGVRGCVPTSRSFQKAVSALEASPGILSHPRLCEEESSANSQVACRAASGSATGERTPSAESANERHVDRVRHRPQPRGEVVEADLAEGKRDGGGETGQTEEDIPENVFRPAAREGAANLAASVDVFFGQLEERLMAYFHKQEEAGDDEAEKLEGEEGNEGSGVVPSGVSTFDENTRNVDAQLVQKDGNSNSKGHSSENGTRKPLRVLVLIDKNFPVDSVPKQTAILQSHCAALNRKLNQACARALHRSVSGQPDSPDSVSFSSSFISTASDPSQDRHSDGSKTLKPMIRAAVCLMTLPPDARQDGSLRSTFLRPLPSTSPCSFASLSFSNSPWAFPWSLPTLCCCLRRVLSRTDHPTLRSRVKRNCGESCFRASPCPVSEQSTSAQSVDLGESHGEFFSARPVSAPGGTRPVGACAVINVFLSFVAMYRHQSLDPADLQKISGVDAVLPCHSVWLPPLKERPASRDRGLRGQDSEATQEESEVRGMAHVTDYYGKSPRREGRESSEASPKRTVVDAFLPPSVEDECYLLIATALQNLRPFSDNIFNVPIYERLVSLLFLSTDRGESAENEKHVESGHQKPSSFGSGPATPASSRDAAGELSTQLEATFERLHGNSSFGSTFTVFDSDCHRQAFEGRRQREGCGSQQPQQERHRDHNRTRNYQRSRDVSHMHSGDAGPHRCSRVAPRGPSEVQANVSEDRRQLLRVGPEFADHVEHQVLREQVHDASGPPLSVHLLHEHGAGESGGDVDGPTSEEPASGRTRETTGAGFILSKHRVDIVEKSKSKLVEPRMRQASACLSAVGISEYQGSAEPVRAAVGSSASRLEEALAHWAGEDEQKKQDPRRVIEVKLPVYFCIDVDRHASLLFALVSSSLDALQANSPPEDFLAAAQRFSQLVQTSLRNVTRLHVTSFYLGGGDVRTTQHEVEVLEAQARQREEDARRRTRSWVSTHMRKGSVAGKSGRSPSVTRGQAGSLCPGGIGSSGSGVRSFSDYSARDEELLAAFVASRRIIGQSFKVEVTHLVFFGEGLVAAGVRPLCSLVLLDNEFDGASRRSGAVSRTASVGANHLQRNVSSLDQQRRGPSADIGQRTTSSHPVASVAGVQYPLRGASLFHSTHDTHELLVCRTPDSRREEMVTSSSTTTAITDRYPHCDGESDTTSSLCFGEKRYPHISMMLARHLKPQFSNVVMTAAANAQRQAQTQGLLLTDTPPIFNTGDRDRGSEMSGATASSQSLFSEVKEHSSENAGQWILFKDLFVAGRRDAALVFCLPSSSVILEGPFLARYN
uniref:Uncharacterized protein n=1 Tax=Toxoplasma gondii TgCATBr9 TaxID=943120 RepID=A0A2T6IRB1_TOXGO|nr:hypothetical protein TGBR9_283550 [Toxoplasma gondii TgCATBr9]